MFAKGTTALKFILPAVLAMTFGAAPALAAVEQCRFIQSKPDREACYQRQEAELAAKRKPEKTSDTTAAEQLEQMPQDEEADHHNLRRICPGCLTGSCRSRCRDGTLLFSLAPLLAGWGERPSRQT